ncbi:hypothetical protein [Neisseria sp. P0019.S003]|uniref:hypothetical protein n=1 Tax=Neisseria sp. P0019.S003 TaxID=3436799 RepID=UPI0035FD401B
MPFIQKNETARNLIEKGFGLFAPVRQMKRVGRKVASLADRDFYKGLMRIHGLSLGKNKRFLLM